MKREKIKPITSKYIILALKDNNEEIENLLKDELLPIQNKIVQHLESIQLETKELKKLKLYD